MLNGARRLIINADDFGLCDAVNQGIIDAHDAGIVTSASLMVDRPAAARAADLAKSRPVLSVGLHVDLGEWELHHGSWKNISDVGPLDNQSFVDREILSQLERFRALIGRDPTHLDSHQHVHLREPVFSVMVRLAQLLHVPLRGVSIDVHHCGEFYGRDRQNLPLTEAISPEGLIEIITRLALGTTELTCHPGRGSGLPATYGSERELELKALLDPGVREAILANQIRLRSFRGIYTDGQCDGVSGANSCASV